MNEAECKAEFRFDKDLPVFAEALLIPPSFKLNQGSIIDGMEAGLSRLAVTDLGEGPREPAPPPPYFE